VIYNEEFGKKEMQGMLDFFGNWDMMKIKKNINCHSDLFQNLIFPLCKGG
jgi:hypothetical protein